MNIGDDAILEGLLRSESEKIIIPITLHPLKDFDYIHEAYLLNGNIRIGPNDGLIIGGGGIFYSQENIQVMKRIADIFYSKGAGYEIRSVGLEYLDIIISDEIRPIVEKLFKNAKKITCRSHYSVDLVNKLFGITASFEKDFSSWLDFPVVDAQNPSFTLGVVLGGGTNFSEELIDTFKELNKKGICLKLIPHSISYNDANNNDEFSLKILFNILSYHGCNMALVKNTLYKNSIQATLNEYVDCDAIFTQRLHGGYFSIFLNKPALFSSNNLKMQTLFEDYKECGNIHLIGENFKESFLEFQEKYIPVSDKFSFKLTNKVKAKCPFCDHESEENFFKANSLIYSKFYCEFCNYAYVSAESIELNSFDTHRFNRMDKERRSISPQIFFAQNRLFFEQARRDNLTIIDLTIEEDNFSKLLHSLGYADFRQVNLLAQQKINETPEFDILLARKLFPHLPLPEIWLKNFYNLLGPNQALLIDHDFSDNALIDVASMANNMQNSAYRGYITKKALTCYCEKIDLYAYSEDGLPVLITKAPIFSYASLAGIFNAIFSKSFKSLRGAKIFCRFLSGFHSDEYLNGDNYFRWTSSGESFVELINLDSDISIISVGILMSNFPSQGTFKIFVNDVLKIESNFDLIEYTFDIGFGKNIIRIETLEPFTAYEISGQPDYRKLGLALKFNS